MTWSVIIPSADPKNLQSCVKTILRAHPDLEPHRIVVVDDGARKNAEAILPGGITWVAGNKPFVFSKNINLGVAASGSDDIIILGDDTRIVTPRCFDKLGLFLAEHPDVGVVSAGILGFVGNPRQAAVDTRPFNKAWLNLPLNERPPRVDPEDPRPLSEGVPQPVPFRFETESLAFICVMIPRSVWIKVGSLDERFTGYGSEDVDYCWRTKEAGLKLAVHFDSLVEHGVMPSTFRTLPTFMDLFARNCGLLEEKWPNRFTAKPIVGPLEQ
jgi:GT2 family glycosyltransferase